jgi:hypothetical protein
LVYLSSLTDVKFESEIPKILEASIRRNKESNITGMLLYCAGNFIQVLEGESEAVVETFKRICEDKRHHNILEILREPITYRDFSEWSMGFNHLTEKTLKAFPKYAHLFNYQPGDNSIIAGSGIALELLRDFSFTNR